MPVDFAKVSQVLSERKQAEKIHGRQARHYSQKALLEVIGQPPTVWKRLEKGNYLPESDARKIADYLGVSLNTVWTPALPVTLKKDPATYDRIVEYLVSIENLAKEIRELLIVQAHQPKE